MIATRVPFAPSLRPACAECGGPIPLGRKGATCSRECLLRRVGLPSDFDPDAAGAVDAANRLLWAAGMARLGTNAARQERLARLSRLVAAARAGGMP